MSEITSSAYPVVTDSQSGDQYTIIRQGQLKKQTRKALEALINSLAPNEFIHLSDSPGTYVGKTGLTLAVNADETGLEFVANSLSPTFATLPDVNAPLAGQGGKTVRVNTAGNGLEYVNAAFVDLSDTPSSMTGEQGKYLKVNPTSDALEWTDIESISNVVLVESESDLPALNENDRHELSPNTAYWFNGQISFNNPIEIVSKTTELFGNGIGETVITYTGLGYGIIATNADASVRLRYLQYVSAGNGIEFVGGGSGAGTNVSLDRAYVIAASGTAINTDSQDFLFMSAAVVIGENPIVISGACGKFTPEVSLIQTTIASTCVDLGSSSLTDIVASGLVFDGVSGSIAISGQASSANIVSSASFIGCIVESGLISLSGITVDDLKYKFSGNVRISDSKTEAMAYISAPSETTIVNGTAVAIAGSWLANADSARAIVSAAGVIEFQNLEEIKSVAHITMSLLKTASGIDDYTINLQKSVDGVSWANVEGVETSISLDANDSRSLSICGVVRFISGDQFRVVVTGNGTSDNITAENAQIVIG